MKPHQLFTTFLLLVVFVPCSALAAQQIVPFIGGGLTMGTGDLRTGTNNGWMVIGGADVPIPALAAGLGAGVTVTYSSLPYSGGFGEATQITTVSGELSYLIGNQASLVRPYLRGGGGLQVHRYDPGSISTNPITDTRPGFSAGAGVNVMMSSLDGVLGVRFASGVDGGILGLHAGVALPLNTSR